MIVAIDSNILIYAHRNDLPFHEKAFHVLKHFNYNKDCPVIPWPCIYEFLTVATNYKIFKNPTTIENAIAQIDHWMSMPQIKLIAEEGETCWLQLKTLFQSSKVTGGVIHDAKIANICSIHRVQVLWTVDRDFSRFPQLKILNPLI